MPYCRFMRFYQPFPTAIPLYEVGYPRVTHPSATKTAHSTSGQALPLHKQSPFDLHVLSTPPAFILSQDQTLMFKFVLSELAGLSSFESRFFKSRFYCLLGCISVWSAVLSPFLHPLSIAAGMQDLRPLRFNSQLIRNVKFLGNFKVVSLFSYQGSTRYFTALSGVFVPRFP